jgi:hypothetical protein
LELAVDTAVVGDEKAFRCEHCRGTTICEHAVWAKGDDGELIVRCGLCGDGVLEYGRSSRRKSYPPVCRVCGGTGYKVPISSSGSDL